jgi:hypothetical protein
LTCIAADFASAILINYRIPLAVHADFLDRLRQLGHMGRINIGERGESITRGDEAKKQARFSP